MNKLATEHQPKIGRFKRSWLLTKGSWTALMLDKELMLLPIIAFAVSIPVLIFYGVIAAVGNKIFFDFSQTANGGDGSVTWYGIALFIALLATLTAISTLTSGAIVHGAIQRFKGHNPTIKSCIKVAWQHAGSLFKFGLLSAGIGFILSEIADRIPFFGGKLLAWLAGAAWNIASFFAIPVIVTSDKPVGPIKATKKSIGIIKEVWGESLILSLGIGLFSVLATVSYTVILISAGVGAAMLGAGAWFLAPFAFLGFLGLLFLMLVFGMLTSFAKAAIYYYATTKESPVMFDKRLLKMAFSPKKARKLFGSI